jgi:hypothetical protein
MRSIAPLGFGCQAEKAESPRHKLMLRNIYAVVNRSALNFVDGFVNFAARILLSLSRGLAPSCQILLIERLAYQRLDHRLPADVQLFGGPVQFFEHARRQVNIYPVSDLYECSA